MQLEHLNNLHASAQKLMIMSVIPERPTSADSAKEAFQRYCKDIDFYESKIHGEACKKAKAVL